MGEIIHEALLIYNFPLTLLMGLAVVYWISVCCGVFDMSSFDADVDMHADIDASLDMHVDADAHVDGDAHVDAGAHHDADHEVGGGAMMSILRFMNVHEVPLMVVLSVQILSMWTIAMFTNHYLNPEGSLLIAGGLFVGNVIVSTIITHLVTAPLKPIMRALKKDWDDAGSLIGNVGVVKTGEVSDDFGQLEIIRKGSPTLCHARVPEGAEPLARGESAMVIDFDPETQICTVKRLEGDQLED